jgi:Flp pilus assembly protein protease CpaA
MIDEPSRKMFEDINPKEKNLLAMVYSFSIAIFVVLILFYGKLNGNHEGYLPGVTFFYWALLAVLILSLIGASFLDVKFRRVPFANWAMLVVLGIPVVVLWLVHNQIGLVIYIIYIITIVIFVLCAELRMMGAADAWIMIFITIFGITIPFKPLLDNVTLGIGASTYVNAIILLFIFSPIYNYYINRKNGVDGAAPLYYKLFAQRISGKDILKNYYEIIDNGVFYMSLQDFFKFFKSGKNRIYTKNLMDDPIKFKEDIDNYTSMEYIWVSPVLPFMVFILVGFLLTILVGVIV